MHQNVTLVFGLKLAICVTSGSCYDALQDVYHRYPTIPWGISVTFSQLGKSVNH